MKRLVFVTALVAAFGAAQAAPTASIGVSVASEDITYISFTWNGHSDGFDIFTSNSEPGNLFNPQDPELFLLNAGGTAVLASNDDCFLCGREAGLFNINLAAGTYWAAIGQYQTTDAEALAGFNPSVVGDPNQAFTTTLNLRANDQTDSQDGFGNFTNVGPSTTTPPGSNGNRVPEPASLVLAGMALGVAGLAGRRRKRT